MCAVSLPWRWSKHGHGKLGNISGKDAAKAFEKSWGAWPWQAGSHLILTKTASGNLTVPLHSELAPGTLRALIRVSGLTVDGFLNFSERIPCSFACSKHVSASTRDDLTEVGDAGEAAQPPVDQA